MSAVPTIRDELNRKTFETIEWLAVSHDLGKITEGQFNTGVDAVFMSVAGLVSDSVMEVVTAASASITDRQDLQVRRHFIRRNRIVTLEWAADQCDVRMVVRVDGAKAKDKNYDHDTPANARAGMGALAARLLDMGFTKL